VPTRVSPCWFSPHWPACLWPLPKWWRSYRQRILGWAEGGPWPHHRPSGCGATGAPHPGIGCRSAVPCAGSGV